MLSYVIPLKICKNYDTKAYWDKLFGEPGRRYILTENGFAFMLEQILSNAIKYTPHGVVTIETAEEKDRFLLQ